MGFILDIEIKFQASHLRNNDQIYSVSVRVDFVPVSSAGEAVFDEFESAEWSCDFIFDINQSLSNGVI